MRLIPFDYQLAGIDTCREEIRKGKRTIIIEMLMAGGKSVLAFEFMKLCAEKGKRSLFLCDRRMLADQAAERARQQELDVGVIQAGRPLNLAAPCQFAMKQTIESWLKREKIVLPDFDLVIVDEAHRGIADSFLKIFERWPNAVRLGLTATPCLGNGSGMGAYYKAIIHPIKPSELLRRGRIVPVRAFAPHVPNLKGVKKDKDGDYQAKSLAERMKRENLVGDVAEWWKRVGEDRPSIYFACDVAHAVSILEEFRSAGITAEIIVDETPDEERDDIQRRSKNGEVKIVVSVDCLAEGIDWPWISCAGLVRPTKRLRRFLQMSGRCMRADQESGKKDALIIDHAGAVLYHGFPDTDREWPLDPLDNADKKNQEKKKEQQTIQCVQCHALFKGSLTCPECGHVHKAKKKPVERANGSGSLVEIAKGADIPEHQLRLLQQRYWATCIATAIKRNRHCGMAASMFSNKFGIPPWQAGVSPLAEGREWKEPASLIWPGFVRGKAKANQGDAFELEMAGK